jgi:hypothetical protein
MITASSPSSRRTCNIASRVVGATNFLIAMFFSRRGPRRRACIESTRAASATRFRRRIARA